MKIINLDTGEVRTIYQYNIDSGHERFPEGFRRIEAIREDEWAAALQRAYSQVPK